MRKTSGKEIVQPQTPIVLCGGGDGEGQDVSIILVPNEIMQAKEQAKKQARNRAKTLSNESEHQGEILAVLKVHSGHLSRCSKYFETCLNERWINLRSTSSSLEFVLETHTDVSYYTDCLSHMYTLGFQKPDFKDVEDSLELLKVASQIQYHELMDSISLSLSSRAWSEAEATMIRLYAASPDFPRQHAHDLLVRLGMDDSSEESWPEPLCDAVEQYVRTALRHDSRNVGPHRALIKHLLSDDEMKNGPGNGEGVEYSSITRVVVKLVINEAKDMLVNVAKECDGQTYQSVSMLANKVLAVSWILEELMAAKAAEEVVQCFVHLHVLPKILNIDRVYQRGSLETDAVYGERLKVQSAVWDAARKLARVVLDIYKEVAAGNLLLATLERAALLRNWYRVLDKLLGGGRILSQLGKHLYSTLPLKEQMDLLVESQYFEEDSDEDYFNTASLAKGLKKRWHDQHIRSLPK